MCHGEERHGGDRGCGGSNGQGVIVIMVVVCVGAEQLVWSVM